MGVGVSTLLGVGVGDSAGVTVGVDVGGGVEVAVGVGGARMMNASGNSPAVPSRLLTSTPHVPGLAREMSKEQRILPPTKRTPVAGMSP